MKTIVIPSDFSQNSVDVAETVIRNSDESVKIIFTHLFRTGDGIQEMLFSTYRKKEYEYVSEAFRQQCDILQDLFGRRFHSYEIDFFYGNRLAPFKNFLDYHGADGIAYSVDYGVPALCKSSLDAIKVVQKAGLPLYEVVGAEKNVLVDKF